MPTRRLSPEGGGHEVVCQHGWWAPQGVWNSKEGNECQWGHWAPKASGLWDLTSVGEENEKFFTRVWKPLPSRGVLKTLGGSPKRKTQRTLAEGLGYYKSCPQDEKVFQPYTYGGRDLWSMKAWGINTVMVRSYGRRPTWLSLTFSDFYGRLSAASFNFFFFHFFISNIMNVKVILHATRLFSWDNYWAYNIRVPKEFMLIDWVVIGVVWPSALLLQVMAF